MSHRIGILVATIALVAAANAPAQSLKIATNSFEEANVSARGIGSDTSLLVTAGRGSVRIRGSRAIEGRPDTVVVWSLEGVRADSTLSYKLPRELSNATHVAGQMRLNLELPSTADLVALNVTLSIPRSIKVVHVQSAGGDVTASDFDGDVIVESDSGTIHGDRLGGGVVAEARNGSIDISMTHRPAPRAVNLLARNGGITLTLPTNPAVKVDVLSACTENAALHLTQGQRDALYAALGIAHQSGTCESNPAEGGTTPSRPQSNSQTFSGQWADGGAALSLRTIRGNIMLRGN